MPARPYTTHLMEAAAQHSSSNSVLALLLQYCRFRFVIQIRMSAVLLTVLRWALPLPLVNLLHTLHLTIEKTTKQRFNGAG